MPTMKPTRKVAPTAPIMDDEGRCLRHPFVQLSRRSSRTGEWKALLDSCPLCVMDISTTGNQAGDESLFVQTAETPGARLRGRKPRQVSSSLPTQRSRSGSSCGSRVRFQPDKDIQFTTTNAVTRAKSVLRASPRYKVCEELMQQQLEVNVKVTTMSMDMSIDFSTLDDEDSRSNFNCNDRHDMEENHQHQHHDRKDHYQHEDDKEQQQQQVEDENANEDEDLLPSLPPPSLPHRNENDSKETPATKHDDKEIESNDNNESQRRQGQERDDASKSGSRGRRSRSYQQVQPILHRPDPEEFLHDDISGCGSQTSTQDHRMQQRSSPSLSQGQRGRREVDIGDHEPRSRSASLSLSNHHRQEHQPQLPQHNPSRSRHASPGSSTRHNHHHNHWQQQPFCTNMVVSPLPNDEEVSALTFMGHSVQSSNSTASPNIHRASICVNSSQEQDEDGPSSSASEVTDKAAPISVMSLSTMMADTNEFDPKTGRCIHHPQVRLRKKKLFGKGWKVMMSACPDCCVGELRRIRLAEENNLKRTLEKRSSIESYSRRVSDLTDDSGYVDNRSTNSSDGSKSGGRGNEGETSTSRSRGNSCSRSSKFHSGLTRFVTDPKSSRRVSDLTDDSGYDDKRSSACNKGSINRGHSDEGGTSATNRRSRSFSCRSGPTSFATSPKSKMTSSSVTKVEPPLPPPPPPRRSSSQDIHRGTPCLPLKKDKLHTQHESDETTVSLTCSDGSSFSDHCKTKKEEDVVSKSNIGDASNHQELEEEERSQVQQDNRGTIHVRQMRWIDPKNGQSGTYTGQVDHHLVPHGCGAMEYDPNPKNDMSGLGVSVVLVKDGEWNDGQFRRNHHRSRSRDNTINDNKNFNGRSVMRSIDGSISAVGSKERDENRLSSSRTWSRSRDVLSDVKHPQSHK